MYLRARRGSPDPADSTTSGRPEAQATLAFVLWDGWDYWDWWDKKSPAAIRGPVFILHSAANLSPAAGLSSATSIPLIMMRGNV